MDRSIFAVIGGDARQIALANLLSSEGNTVYCSGLEYSARELVGTASTDPNTAVTISDIVILPMPPTRDGITLNAPLSRYNIPLDDRFCSLLSGKAVFAGMAEKIRELSPAFAELNLFDYGVTDSFLQRNAQATAEGALAEIIINYPRTICGSHILITGFGRIAGYLAPMLRSIGANVSVAARNSSDRAKISSLGMEALTFGRALRKIKNFDLVINTVPAEVIDGRMIEGMSPDVLMIELASAPGGIDYSACEKKKIRLIRASGLPGKYSPLTAAEIIKDTVMSVLEEE